MTVNGPVAASHEEDVTASGSGTCGLSRRSRFGVGLGVGIRWFRRASATVVGTPSGRTAASSAVRPPPWGPGANMRGTVPQREASPDSAAPQAQRPPCVGHNAPPTEDQRGSRHRSDNRRHQVDRVATLPRRDADQPLGQIAVRRYHPTLAVSPPRRSRPRQCAAFSLVHALDPAGAVRQAEKAL